MTQWCLNTKEWPLNTHTHTETSTVSHMFRLSHTRLPSSILPPHLSVQLLTPSIFIFPFDPDSVAHYLKLAVFQVLQRSLTNPQQIIQSIQNGEENL